MRPAGPPSRSLSLPHYFATSRRPTAPASSPSSGRSSLSSQVRMPRTSLPSAPPAHIHAALPGRHPHRSLALLWWPPRRLRSCSAVHHVASREHRTDERLVRGQAGPHAGAEVQRGCRESALDASSLCRTDLARELSHGSAHTPWRRDSTPTSRCLHSAPCRSHAGAHPRHLRNRRDGRQELLEVHRRPTTAVGMVVAVPTVVGMALAATISIAAFFMDNQRWHPRAQIRLRTGPISRTPSQLRWRGPRASGWWGGGGGDGGVQLTNKLEIFKINNFDPNAYV